MSSDPLDELLKHLRAKEGTKLPTSAFGRLRRTASAGARAGLGVLTGRLRGGDGSLGSLAPEALAKLVESFGELKGVAMKAGQILSYVDASLAPEARELLAVLQIHSQPTPFPAIEEAIRGDLGSRAEALLARIEREPVATASIGQVHRAMREDGTAVAVKVRHPGIEAAIRADFKAAAIGKILAHVMAPGVNVAEIIAEAETRFLEECDYTLEARRQRRFAELYEGHDSLSIPAVHLDWSGPRVLTTTWHDGTGLEAFLVSPASGVARERAARALYEFYVGTLYRHGLFNADPHPGNLLFAPDGGVTILDHGCVREFEREVVVALVRLSRAVRADDARETEGALRALGMPKPTQDFDVTRRLLRGFYAPLLAPGRHVRLELPGIRHLQPALAIRRVQLYCHLFAGSLAFVRRHHHFQHSDDCRPAELPGQRHHYRRRQCRAGLRRPLA